MLASQSLTPAERKLERVRVVLGGYISRILVESVLRKAVTAANYSRRGSLTSAQLETIVEDCMVGLRLFVAEEKLPELMLTLTEILTEPSDDALLSKKTVSGTYRSG